MHLWFSSWDAALVAQRAPSGLVRARPYYRKNFPEVRTVDVLSRSPLGGCCSFTRYRSFATRRVNEAGLRARATPYILAQPQRPAAQPWFLSIPRNAVQ